MLPYELAVLAFVAPIAVHLFSSNYDWCEAALTDVTTVVARQLRLSSYLFDRRASATVRAR